MCQALSPVGRRSAQSGRMKFLRHFDDAEMRASDEGHFDRPSGAERAARVALSV
jgi:hypothetical protein